MQNSFLVIYGPTGVGKSDASLAIASGIPSEIINMDVGQFYTPFTIGTAKPIDWQSNPIPHHMFDILDTPKSLTVVEYRDRVSELIADIQSRGKLPILVGGSGFYLRSLLFPPVVEEDKKESNFLTSISWDDLYKIDPQRAQEIERHDAYRIARALEIWRTTGKIPSKYKPEYNPIGDYTIMFLTRDRQELYHRINQRVDIMFELGWLSEIREVIGTEWEQFILEKKLIGYDELVNFLHEGSPPDKFDKVVEKIKQRTRHYAKRQLTFWRMLQQQIVSTDPNKKNQLYTINLTTAHLDDEVKRILQDIKNNF